MFASLALRMLYRLPQDPFKRRHARYCSLTSAPADASSSSVGFSSSCAVLRSIEVSKIGCEGVQPPYCSSTVTSWSKRLTHSSLDSCGRWKAVYNSLSTCTIPHVCWRCSSTPHIISRMIANRFTPCWTASASPNPLVPRTRFFISGEHCSSSKLYSFMLPSWRSLMSITTVLAASFQHISAISKRSLLSYSSSPNMTGLVSSVSLAGAAFSIILGRLTPKPLRRSGRAPFRMAVPTWIPPL